MPHTQCAAAPTREPRPTPAPREGAAGPAAAVAVAPGAAGAGTLEPEARPPTATRSRPRGGLKVSEQTHPLGVPQERQRICAGRCSGEPGTTGRNGSGRVDSKKGGGGAGGLAFARGGVSRAAPSPLVPGATRLVTAAVCTPRAAAVAGDMARLPCCLAALLPLGAGAGAGAAAAPAAAAAAAGGCGGGGPGRAGNGYICAGIPELRSFPASCVSSEDGGGSSSATSAQPPPPPARCKPAVKPGRKPAAKGPAAAAAVPPRARAASGVAERCGCVLSVGGPHGVDADRTRTGRGTHDRIQRNGRGPDAGRGRG
eukprot:gene17714-biopygen17351